MKNMTFKIFLLFAFMVIGLSSTQPGMSAQDEASFNPVSGQGEVRNACSGGPSIDHILLDECYTESFLIGGVTKTITVWYTKAHHVPYPRTLNNGDVITLSHWIDSDDQAVKVADWGRLAWEQYYEIFGLSPYQGSTDIIYIQLEDGIAGYANIPADGPWIHLGVFLARGSDPLPLFHEFGHAVQDSYANCFLRPGIYPGNAEFTEGYACVSADSVEPVSDAAYYGGYVASYNHSLSFYEHDGNNVANKYFLEQTGHLWPSDTVRYHVDAVRAHYEQCNILGTNYAYDELIRDLTGGALNEKTLFLNFFAANWAKDWADPVTQPELVYFDDDVVSYGNVPLDFDVSPNNGSWDLALSRPKDVWAAKYFQFRPQADCAFVSARVVGWPNTQLGINLMAADTIGSTRVTRSAVIGTELSRTFLGAGVNDRIVAIVNAFEKKEYFSVEFECVTPTVTLVEPRAYPNPTRVGVPSSPIAFLAIFEATDGGEPVVGIPESLFSVFAGTEEMSFVPGSFQQVGNQYWALVIPPDQQTGTAYVDMSLCLNADICDTNHAALLYEERGNADVALVFDASGSMDFEDVIGEGRRIDNAKRAGNVQASLLQNGDQVIVMDFSALDFPLDCGLPDGDGDCLLDLMTYLERTAVVVPATIDATRIAVNSISPREWTPIGAALKEANAMLQADPLSTNPKVIVLLSDGEENVNPLIAEVVGDLQAAGTIVNTIGFGLPGEVGEDKLAQLAADTNGTFIFVPTSGTSTRSASLEQLEVLREYGVSETLLSRIASLWQPGPLALDAVYDYFDAQAQGAHRLFSIPQVAVPNLTWKQVDQYVDASTTELRFVVAAKQAEDGSTIRRAVRILEPGADPNKGWIDISPPDSSLPSNWDVRNSPYDDTLIITNPKKGFWGVKVIYNRTNSMASDFVMMASAQSDYVLQGRFLAPIVDFQGHQGDVVPIVATLMDRNKGVKGAFVIANVLSPNGSSSSTILHDDGLHSDGGEGDGIYGALFAPTYSDGVYSVDVIAEWEDPNNPGNDTQAEWLGSFFIPKGEDLDGDRMPDAWESACGMKPNEFDPGGDLDGDGLTNVQEFTRGTSPCNDDTDHGGENDYSEVTYKRNPLEPTDDEVLHLPHFSILAMNAAVRIDWYAPDQLGSIQVFVSTLPDVLGSPQDMGQSGSFTLNGLTNDQPYYLTFRVMDGAVAIITGAFSEQYAVTPKADPDPPSGYIFINGGIGVTHSRIVQLSLLAEDTLRLGDPLPILLPGRTSNEVSGVADMMISNDPFFTGAVWEHIAYEKIWTLEETCFAGCRVYAKFRDVAGNESQVYSYLIQFKPIIFLPLMFN